MLQTKDELAKQWARFRHVDEPDGRLVPGGSILAVPVHPGRAALAAALFGLTMGFTCAQTIHFRLVVLSMSPALREEMAVALQELIGDFEFWSDEAAKHADSGVITSTLVLNGCATNGEDRGDIEFR